MENVQSDAANTPVVSKLFDLNTNISLLFISLLTFVGVLLSSSVGTAANVSYLDTFGIGEAPYTDFVFFDYFNFFKDSPFVIIPFLIALAPISFLRKVLISVLLFTVAIFGTFFVLGFNLEISEYGLYPSFLQSFIKDLGIYLVGCYLIGFLVGSFVYYILVAVSSGLGDKISTQDGVLGRQGK